jgi:ABC-type nickel/cobalt efflux system permease component RcnA
MRILGAMGCLLIALMLCWQASAEETGSPFAKPIDGGVSAVAPSSTTASGIVTTIGRTFVGLQRTVNRAINDRLVAIKRGEDKGALWGGLVVAFLYGVFHALGPGHGKTVVIGYFLGRAARPWRGVAMAGWIAVSHVMGAVVVVGVARLILEKSLVTPTNEFLWLRVTSYGAIVLVGLMMLLDWARGGHNHSHHDHAGCDHPGLGHTGHGHSCHAGDTSWLNGHAPLEQRALALAAGFVPCSGAILILLFTLANGLLVAGIAMAIAIAFGMGLTLAGLGVASILLRHQVSVRLPEGGRTGRWLALSGPVFVIAIGGILLAATLLTQVSI